MLFAAKKLKSFVLGCIASTVLASLLSAQVRQDLDYFAHSASSSEVNSQEVSDDEKTNSYQFADDSMHLFQPQEAGEGNVEMGWWSQHVSRGMRSGTTISLSLEDVLARTLIYSEQVKVFGEIPMIRRTAIIEADAAFDWNRFLETRWDDLSDPVGNSLTVGGNATRFNDQQWSGRAGTKRKNRRGGEFEIGQSYGWQQNNSTFFIPNPQGTARLVLNYNQPLLRGRGTVYNESLLVLAQIDKKIADDEFRRQLQSHLLEVTRAYWSLYLERGVLFQKMNSFQRANEIYDILKKRASIDAQQSQIASARATATTRNAELIRAQTAVKNAESRLRSLVNDPELGSFDETEIIPLDTPTNLLYEVGIQESMSFAIQNRPEVLQALKQIQAGTVRLSMSKHELLPVLNLITEAYVAGLRPDGDAIDAWTQQFEDGRPSYSVGLEYEIPVGNRTAAARHTRRRLELRQLKGQYQTMLETVKLEVAVAVREIDTSSREMFAKQEAMQARASQLDALTKRWRALPGEDVVASLALENLLDAQDRLAAAEFEFLESQLTYNLALMNIKRVTGTLLQTENVVIGEDCQNGLPIQVLGKSAAPDSRMAPTPTTSSANAPTRVARDTGRHHIK